MKDVLIFILFLIAAASGDEGNSFIVGGRDAAIGQFPYMVSIRIQQPGTTMLAHVCGGGIINRNWVLTAAHCLLSGREREVVAGAVRLQDRGQRYGITRSFRHPDYSTISNSHWHDIGLVRVTDIIFSQHVQPIRLNRDHIFFPTPATLCGFGHASTNLNQVRASDRLQFKDTTILTSADCTTRVNNARAFNPTIYPGHICTLAGRGIGGCYGDSGSPLVANGGIVGVVSFGLPCAQGVPDILARVSHYLRWIDTTMSVNFRA